MPLSLDASGVRPAVQELFYRIQISIQGSDALGEPFPLQTQPLEGLRPFLVLNAALRKEKHHLCPGAQHRPEGIVRMVSTQNLLEGPFIIRTAHRMKARRGLSGGEGPVGGAAGRARRTPRRPP